MFCIFCIVLYKMLLNSIMPTQIVVLTSQADVLCFVQQQNEGQNIVGRIAADALSTHCGRRTAVDALRPMRGLRAADTFRPTLNLPL